MEPLLETRRQDIATPALCLPQNSHGVIILGTFSYTVWRPRGSHRARAGKEYRPFGLRAMRPCHLPSLTPPTRLPNPTNSYLCGGQTKQEQGGGDCKCASCVAHCSD